MIKVLSRVELFLFKLLLKFVSGENVSFVSSNINTICSSIKRVSEACKYYDGEGA